MDSEEISRVVAELRAHQEAEWLEFKESNADPEEIGRTISAIANSAAFLGRARGFIVWGIEDGTRRLVGTAFRPREEKKGSEELESWLSHEVRPGINFRIHEALVGGVPVVLFEVPAARHTPTRFRETAYIRIGSYTKKLADHAGKEAGLWTILSRTAFEDGIAKTNASAEEVLKLLDYPSYFELSGHPLPPDRSAILQRLEAEKLIVRSSGDRFDVTNLGAILFAKDLNALGLGRKAVRVVIYSGENRVTTLREQTGSRGYATGFRGLIKYINDQLPQNEEIRQALRIEQRMYPEVAVRELVANALIHQDLALTGTGPMIEIFQDRMEITNPGQPLIEPVRFLDAPPQSRNDVLGAFMRRLKMCEERGSGIDKVILAAEVAQLPAPDFRVTAAHTKAIMYAHRPFSKMSKEDRIRACYQHAALLYVSGQQMTNATLRKRFSIKAENYATVSRIIADTLKSGLIKPVDPANRSRRHAKYLPFWA